MNEQFWRAKRVFVSGHTGFKGSWLSLWLQSLGAEVQGYALTAPTTPSLFESAKVARGMRSTLGDVRDLGAVKRCMMEFRPDIILHMAAQPLVRASYSDPVTTYATNVMGTVHVLEAARQAGSVRCFVNVTTDKCYENREWLWGYRENDRMGGRDPYSSSKACSELVTSAYRQSFFEESGGTALASARAGNVIGGGDWASDRLVPDILRAFEQRTPVTIRNPGAIRPWQHVIEPLCGYLTLAERLWNEGAPFAEGWNFGPSPDEVRPVQWIVERLTSAWGCGANWNHANVQEPHEAHHLTLDISKARRFLSWHPRWNLSTALDHVVHWHKAWLRNEDIRVVCLRQIQQYLDTRDGIRP